MKAPMSPILAMSIMAALLSGTQAAELYVSPQGGNARPFTNWVTAATNIQDAVDVAWTGDVIWVTNGVYATGGRVMAGDLTNRVALDKALTVQSVNGPQATVIQGRWDPASTNGPEAVRCAWLTNGAVLNGFTLSGGATRSTGDDDTLQRGGGVWCAFGDAVATNCVISGNSASWTGGGSYWGTLNNCTLTVNSATDGGGSYYSALNNCTLAANSAFQDGGGAHSGTLNNCVLTANFAGDSGGGACAGTLSNCALTDNFAGNGGGSCFCTLNNCTLTGNSATRGGGYYFGTVNNCIVWDNLAPSGQNYYGGTLTYTCALPLPPGAGNIAADPQFLADGVHIAATSPCRGMGSTNYVSGTDVDGQPWANPPAMGCDEWYPSPAITAPPQWQPGSGAGQALLTTVVAGQGPFYWWWIKDGAPIEDGPHYGGADGPSLLVRGFGFPDAGAYQVVVSNSFGMTTSPLVRVAIHCVDAAGAAPVAPYTNWETAATTIQAAIDTAAPGAVILVTNGVYATGGTVIAGNLTNRVALAKAVMVWSVNGPQETVIQGQRGAPVANGPSAVRCAWLANGAALSGFTLSGGATRSTGDADTLQSGGGVWCASTNAVVANCFINGNSAYYGGGSCSGTLNNCTLTANSATTGGGCYLGSLNNCVLTDNLAGYGGGSCSGTLNNCTLTANSASQAGGGSFGDTLNNCIVWGNGSSSSGNYYGGTFRYTCASPLPPGPGNIGVDPQLLADGAHIAVASPCRGAGTNSFVSGTDIDGQPWANPPAMGCDEWYPPPALTALPQWQFAGQAVLTAVVAGQDPFYWWWTKDGAPIEDGPHYGGAHSPNVLVRGLGLADAGAYQVVVSNAFGTATSSVARVGIHCVDAAGATPVAPYTNWETAATMLQAAIDAAAPGAVILVTNGVYAAGGRVMAGDLTNRVALDKAMMVWSVNGPQATVIQGQWDQQSTNGPGAVRCAWLANGTVLNGFTLNGGATRSTGDWTTLESGGGVWCASTNAAVANCIIRGNAAYLDGGGSYSGTLDGCALTGNLAGYGGGSCLGTLNSCALTRNLAHYGGGSSLGTLNNCTLTANSASWYGSGSYADALNNCILWQNVVIFQRNGPMSNYAGSTLCYTCASPVAPGPGNIAVDPQLLADGVHIAATSPCRGAGTNSFASGTDIDGQPWADPPAMGCDEWYPQPLIVLEPCWQLGAGPSQALLAALVAGQEPFYCWWTNDGAPIEDGPHYGGAHTPNLLVRRFGAADAGTYQLVVSNAFGMATSQVARAHCADAAATTPLVPFTSWATAAATIQAAIDVAAPGAVILVTNGVYAAGGKAIDGDLTNRVVLDKGVIVWGLNGPQGVVIQGQRGQSSANGPGAVRCAWLADGAMLHGVTLSGGATRLAYQSDRLGGGGGVWCVSTNALVTDCVLTGNVAFIGGGSYSGTLNNCILATNLAYEYGGGSYSSALNNCALTGNTAYEYGGGAASSTLNNCTLTGNSASQGGGFFWSTLTNCIVWGNLAPYDPYYSHCTLSYTCASPLAPGAGNIAVDPQLVDAMHIAANSPCRGNGAAGSATGTDIDGEAWANPPSMGCDEVWESALTGPLTVGLSVPWTNVGARAVLPLSGQVTGRASILEWSFGDGVVSSNRSYLTTYTWANAGDYTVTLTAFNADNPAGASANLLIHVAPLALPILTPSFVSSNGLQLAFGSQAGVAYVVEYATNLAPPVVWQTLQSPSGTGGVIGVQDSNATDNARFYRVRIP